MCNCKLYGNAWRAFRNIAYFIKYIFRFDKAYIILGLGVNLLSVVAPITEIWGPKQIVDMLSNRAAISNIISLILIITGLEILKMLVFAVYRTIYLPVAQSRLKSRINLELFKKSSSIEMRYFEITEFYDRYTRALNEADSRFIMIMDSLGRLLSTIVYLATMGYIINSLDAAMLCVIVIAVIATFFLKAIQSKVYYQYDKKITPIDRKMSYIRRIFYESAFAKEIRVYNMTDFLFRKYSNSEKNKSVLLAGKGKSSFLLESLMGLLRILLLITFVMVYLAIRIESGDLTVGAFLALFLAVTQSSNQLIDLINSLSEIYQHSIYIENFKSIMDIQTEMPVDPDDRGELSKEVFRLENVAFSYPSTNGNVLDSVSLCIQNGEKIALVGPNGAGKSTFVKIMLGLYQATGGTVFYKNIEMNPKNAPVLREKIGVMFQDFSIYAFSIAENILLSEVKNDEDEAVVVNALQKVGLYDKVSQLKNGIYTVLSREFDENGITFSGGELQKIVLARILAKDRDIVIFDEPSSALDPISENDFFESMMDITQGKTVVYITHRLTTIKLASRIIYIENGRIYEDGTFEELMNLNGRFAEMYRLQMQRYIF